MSIVCGTTACNAHCPFCVSKTTPERIQYNHWNMPESINWINFKRACRLAQIGNATTVLITGKGEPTLYPRLLTGYLRALQPYDFPFIELQTNGIFFGTANQPPPPPPTKKQKDTILGAMQDPTCEETLQEWKTNGLTTICLSAVHYRAKENQRIYSPQYPSLIETAKLLNGFGFTIRLSIMMLQGYIDTWQEVMKLVGFCQENSIKQLTIRAIDYPENVNNDVTKWIYSNTISKDMALLIQDRLETYAKPILHLSHGATVYDYNGQNICYANCLTTNNSMDDLRQIIFFPDGTIAYDWKYEGAVLL